MFAVQVDNKFSSNNNTMWNQQTGYSNRICEHRKLQEDHRRHTVNLQTAMPTINRNERPEAMPDFIQRGKNQYQKARLQEIEADNLRLKNNISGIMEKVTPSKGKKSKPAQHRNPSSKVFSSPTRRPSNLSQRNPVKKTTAKSNKVNKTRITTQAGKYNNPDWAAQRIAEECTLLRIRRQPKPPVTKKPTTTVPNRLRMFQLKFRSRKGAPIIHVNNTSICVDLPPSPRPFASTLHCKKQVTPETSNIAIIQHMAKKIALDCINVAVALIEVP